MCSDWPSVPTRGSRLAGLLSMRKTTVRGSRWGEWQAERRSASEAMMAKYVLSHPWRKNKNAPRMGHPWLLVRSGIGDLAEEGGAGGAGGCGHVAGEMMPCLPGKESEGGGFLGLNWKSECGAGGDLAAERLEMAREHGYQSAVAGAAAGHDAIDGPGLR